MFGVLEIYRFYVCWFVMWFIGDLSRGGKIEGFEVVGLVFVLILGICSSISLNRFLKNGYVFFLEFFKE